METSDSVKKPDDKVCRVCGDKALGYNFSVITCESCKAFFRRNAVKDKQHKCPFQNECKIDTVTRRFCQKCRLDKCLDVGMKKEWIMSEEEKQLKNAKINENKSRRKLENNNDSPSTFEFMNGFQPANSNGQFFANHASKPQARVNAMPQQPDLFANGEQFEPPPSKISKIQEILSESYTNYVPDESIFIPEHTTWKPCNMQSLPSVKSFINKKNVHSPDQHKGGLLPQNNDSNVNSKELRSVNLDFTQTETLCSSVNDNSNLDSGSWLKDSVNNVLKIAISAEYSDLANQSAVQNVGSNSLTLIEEQKIKELITANEVMKLSWDNEKTMYEKNTDNPCLIDVINMTDNAIRKLIKMSKKITAFKCLCQDDQIALLKGSSVELMILRSAMTYDSENDGWCVPPGMEVPDNLKSSYIRMDVLKEAKGDIYEVHKQFVKSFDPIWRNDEKLMIILTSIVLFNPTRPNVVHFDVIKLEQYSYYFLLQRYLESTRSRCNAKSQFLKLIQTIQDLQKLHENHIKIFMDLNPKDVEPLLIEIFDVVMCSSAEICLVFLNWLPYGKAGDLACWKLHFPSIGNIAIEI
ncbi:Nuclear hormone receptor HR96 [Nymphon striatum]|nr:Nuclear hormone receptor HR96 [Nymphon striatum]